MICKVWSVTVGEDRKIAVNSVGDKRCILECYVIAVVSEPLGGEGLSVGILICGCSILRGQICAE